ncbi:peroxiredoxin [Mangrovicella endophytica]|uniref:peroxiredoxin n=1 Tax=Mangrovicella endophytica TaxID=2066697 RepID=UPI000C9E53D4|nr:peroxiredoxin [Mangrovicella endophytica]
MSTLTEGSAFPPFSLADDRGGTVSLDSLKGKPFVVYFYPKDDTSGCTLEAIEFTALAADYAAAGVPVFGVSPDPVKKHCKFREKHGLSVELLSDEGHTLLEPAGVWVEKSMYGRKYMGVERTTALVGRDGIVLRVWEKVKVPEHAREVLEAARKLTA